MNYRHNNGISCGRKVCADRTNRTATGSGTVQLSPRELEVTILLTKGLINKEIADRMNISITTVITHRKNIMEKLHARSLADIIIYAVMNGYVNLGEL
jgi:DNA-binding NarL/FixJ family response regulator